MSVTIPDAVLQAARMSEADLQEEIAVLLYQKEKLTLSQARDLVALLFVKIWIIRSEEMMAWHKFNIVSDLRESCSFFG